MSVSPRLLLPACLAMAALLLTGCKKESCLGNEESCRVVSPCEKLGYTCNASPTLLEVRKLTPEDIRAGSLGPATGPSTVPGGINALGARGDILLGNDRAVAVIAGIGTPHLLDPNGGALLDLSARGKDNDGLNQILQVVGILPGDAVRYTHAELIDERPNRVAVQLRGTLDGKPEFPVHTIYEMRPCEPGVRVRTEILNTSVDPQFWALSDGFYWSGREALPFTPSAGTGFQHPSFDLLTIDAAYRRFPYLTATLPSEPGSSYSVVSCKQPLLEGFHSDQISSAGLAQTIVQPRDYLVYERFLTVSEAASGDVASSADLALEARQQLHGDRYITLSGTVGPRNAPLKAGREVSILISEGSLTAERSNRIPWTQVTPGADGRFQARVPAGRDYAVELHAFGRKVADRQLTEVEADHDVGTLALPSSTRLTVNVNDAVNGQGLHAELFLIPVDETSREEIVGSLHGRFGSCAPWLGSPAGPSPACNRILVHNGTTTVDVPMGRYHLYAFKGPFWTIDRETTTFGAEDASLSFQLQELPLQPAGTVSADLHVHGAASFDSSLPDNDRVLSFAATDLDVVVSTDHDVVYDYTTMLKQLGLEQNMSTVTGLETTGHILWMKRAGSSVPLVVGHYNFWPLQYDPTKPRNGAPSDELVEPGELFDRVKESAPPALREQLLIQLNHPWADAEFGRDLGFPRALAMDLNKNLPARDDGTSSGIYVRTPKGGFANNSQHAQEVMNGTQNDKLMPYRAFWFYVLNQGQPVTGTANSDSHSLTDNTVGVPRNIVYADTLPGPSFDTARFNRALKAGSSFGTNGPVIEATVDTATGRTRYGLAPIAPSAGAQLHLKVSAAPWVPVEELRIIVNGKVVKAVVGEALAHPAAPFGVDGLVRYEGSLALSELLPASGDAWLIVEAGSQLPLVGDLGGPNGAPDGVPDTSDNNGDGRIDVNDVGAGTKYGPLRNPTPPASEADPLFHFAQVVSDGYPMAFTNPFFLDRDGNGRFDAPGVGAP
jgi:hypothetical protein